MLKQAKLRGIPMGPYAECKRNGLNRLGNRPSRKSGLLGDLGDFGKTGHLGYFGHPFPREHGFPKESVTWSPA